VHRQSAVFVLNVYQANDLPQSKAVFAVAFAAIAAVAVAVVVVDTDAVSISDVNVTIRVCKVTFFMY